MSEKKNTGYLVMQRVAAALDHWDLDAYESLLEEQAIEGRPQIEIRFVGRNNIMGTYRSVPGRPTFSWQGIRGGEAVWVLEGTIHYGEGSEYVVGIYEIAEGRVMKADWYFAPPLDQSPYHAQWSEPVNP